MSLWDGFRSECEHRLRAVIEPAGFDYAGFHTFGRGGYCSWLLEPERETHLKIWAEYDGSIMAYAVLSLERRGRRNRPVTTASMYVAKFNHEQLGDQGAAHISLGSMEPEQLQAAVVELERQLRLAIPHLPAMIAALRARP